MTHKTQTYLIIILAMTPTKLTIYNSLSLWIIWINKNFLSKINLILWLRTISISNKTCLMAFKTVTLINKLQIIKVILFKKYRKIQNTFSRIYTIKILILDIMSSFITKAKWIILTYFLITLPILTSNKIKIILNKTVISYSQTILAFLRSKFRTISMVSLNKTSNMSKTVEMNKGGKKGRKKIRTKRIKISRVIID